MGRHSGLSMGYLLLSLCTLSLAVHATASCDAFRQGKERYIAGDYNAASVAFEQAVESAPEVAQYHYWLGKSYGRRAERASWMDALGLAKKTRISLEKAVALDPDDVDALSALIEYYETAPFFLGGSRSKAAEYQRHLDSLLDARQTQASNELTLH